MATSRSTSTGIAVLVFAIVGTTVVVAEPKRTGSIRATLAAASIRLFGAGSPTLVADGATFAAPEIAQWVTDVARSPYNLGINFTPRNSKDARYDFAGKTVDFAVSDIRYQPFPYDTATPKEGTFIYLPVTAGGVAFMYHLDGVPDLKLSSYSACALFTGGVLFWDDPIVAADNPGVALPHVKVTPVLNGDSAGINFVVQEYCIAQQPALWRAFYDGVKDYSARVGVTNIFPERPSSDWPRFPSGVFPSGSTAMADTVAAPQSNGYLTDVETSYAIQRHTPVASVKNASGKYVKPGEVNVASALAYARQEFDGTHVLDFGGIGPHVYNPSTYSYVIAPTAGLDPAKGAVLGAFLNYALTLGQQKAGAIGYASLGLSLERQGVERVKGIPGAPPLRPEEEAGYACGDLTPALVAAGATTPECGSTNPNTAPSSPGGGAGGGNGPGDGGGSGGTTAPTRRGAGTGAGPGGSGGGAGTTGRGTQGSGELAGPSGGAGTRSPAAAPAGTATGAGARTSGTPSRTQGGGSASPPGSGGAVGAPAEANATLDPGPAVGPLGTTGFEADLLFLAGAGLALGGGLVQRRARKRRPA